MIEPRDGGLVLFGVELHSKKLILRCDMNTAKLVREFRDLVSQRMRIMRAMREADIQHEVFPVVGFISSLLLGAVGTALAIMYSYTLPLTEAHSNLLLVPASFSTIWTGFLMLTTRRKAINQVLGFLLLENGILMFGLLLLEAMPFLVEAGVLLDLFTGVFVMGIIIHHISREFASMSTEYLSELKE